MYLTQNPEQVKRAVENALRTDGALSPGSTAGFQGASFQGGLAGSDYGSCVDPAPISVDVEALIKCLCAIKDNLTMISEKLFGPVPECCEQKCPAPDSVRNRIISAGALAHNIAQDIQSVRNRI